MVGSMHVDINADGLLFREAQNIAEELKIMKRVYSEQLSVTKELKRHLHGPLGRDDGMTAARQQGEIVALKRLLEIRMGKGKEVGNESNADGTTAIVDGSGEGGRWMSVALEETLHEAEDTIELIESRQAEIQDLEDSALWACKQVR